MNIEQLATYVAQKVGRSDPYSISLAEAFANTRHRLIYESFDWKSAQVVSNIVIETPPEGDIEAPGYDKIISLRYNGEFLDPVLTQFIFDTHPEMLDATGTPQFYTETYNQETGTRNVRLFPLPDQDELGDAGAELLILGKLPFNADAVSIIPQVPYVENALIAYVEADMLSWLRQYGKAKQTRDEADALLEKAKANDTPPAARARQGKVLTVNGNSLIELVDSVCAIIGDWLPETRIRIKEFIRRNWQTIWEMALWPESCAVARVTATNREQLIMPSMFDRVVAIRPDDGSIQQLRNAEISLFFNIDPQIFERDDPPVYFSMLSPSATPVLPHFAEPIAMVLIGTGSGGPLTRHPHFVDETIEVFIKGEGSGTETAESVTVNTMPPTGGPVHVDDVFNFTTPTINSYDMLLTLAKPITLGTLYVYGAISHRLLMTLGGNERSKKHLRVWLLPNRRMETSVASLTHSTDLTTTPPTYLVLGKRQMSPLIDDNDSCQLRNVENILIAGATADILTKSDANQAQVYRAKAAELLKILLSGETEQNAHEPTITPYVEPTYQLRGN